MPPGNEPLSDPVQSGRRNIRLKARWDDINEAGRIARSLATSQLATQHQIDTYFHSPRGRLKLRQIDGLTAMLVSYRRPDFAAPRQATTDWCRSPIRSR